MSRFGTEVLRVTRADDVDQLDEWIHDAYVEDALDFDAAANRVVVPFLQESGWGTRHPSMAEPELVKKTPLAEHYEVPLTRCFIVVDHAQDVDVGIDWGCPMLEEATFADSTIRLHGIANLAIPVTDIDVRVFVTTEDAGRLLRKVLRGGWPAQSDRWLEPPA